MKNFRSNIPGQLIDFNEVPTSFVQPPLGKQFITSIDGFQVSLREDQWKNYKKDPSHLKVILSVSLALTLTEYLQPIDIFKLTDKDLKPYIIDQEENAGYDQRNIRMLNRFMKKYPDQKLRFRLESDNYSSNFALAYTGDKIWEGICFFSDMESKVDCIASIAIDTGSYDNYTVTGFTRLSFMVAATFVTSKKERISSEYLKLNNEKRKEFEFYCIKHLNLGLSRILKDGSYIDNSKALGDTPEYNYIEMIGFKKIIKSMGLHNIICPLKELSNANDVNRCLSIKTEEDIFQIPEVFKSNDPKRDFPLIELSKREVSFIREYVESNIVKEDGFNLIPYLTEPRYGKTIRCNMFDVVDTIFTYKINHEHDELRVFVKIRLSDGIDHIASVWYKDLSHFKFEKNLMPYVEYLDINDMDNIPNSISDIPEFDLISDGYMNACAAYINQILRIFIAIHDRPERTKMVKCVKKEYYEKKERNIKVDEKDYIIWRILKTKAEAKSYIKKMTGSRADAEYVMEEWERAGHYRTTKTGKTIWIRETTCKRHLPLTEKEIRIKL